jgi:hypothetical protein
MKIGQTLLIWTAFGLLSGCGISTSNKEKISTINIGDSLFVISPTHKGSYFTVGNIKRVPIISKEELRRINYSRKDTLGFESDMIFPQDAEECFFKFGSTFIGLCVGRDSAQTEYGTKYYVKVKPSDCLKSLINKSVTLKQQGTYHIDIDDIFKTNQLKK